MRAGKQPQSTYAVIIARTAGKDKANIMTVMVYADRCNETRRCNARRTRTVTDTVLMLAIIALAMVASIILGLRLTT